MEIIMTEKIERTMKNLNKNNIETFYVEKKEEVVLLVEKLVPQGATVAAGGSVSLTETGVLEHLRNGKYNFLDRYAEGLSREDIVEIFKKSFGADAYFCSSNAITEDGELYNVDGNANRISAISFGPKNVIMVVGVNKIVKDIDEAILRVKTVAAPKNCKRLSCKTYCFEKGHCVDLEGGMGKGCSSPQRVCRHYLVSSKQAVFGRIKVIFVNEELGY